MAPASVQKCADTRTLGFLPAPVVGVKRAVGEEGVSRSSRGAWSAADAVFNPGTATPSMWVGCIGPVVGSYGVGFPEGVDRGLCGREALGRQRFAVSPKNGRCGRGRCGNA